VNRRKGSVSESASTTKNVFVPTWKMGGDRRKTAAASTGSFRCHASGPRRKRFFELAVRKKGQPAQTRPGETKKKRESARHSNQTGLEGREEKEYQIHFSRRAEKKDWAPLRSKEKGGAGEGKGTLV